MWTLCGRLILTVLAFGCVGALRWHDREVPPRTARVAHVAEGLSSIPVGTVLPLRLEKTISTKGARGQAVEAKVAQDVPLPDGEKIAMKSTVRGSILSVETDADGPGVKVTLKFDQLEQRQGMLTIRTYLRAIASGRAVQAAQMPHSGADMGSPGGWADTVQIGGDIRFGDGGVVRDRAKEKVGKGVVGGVLVHVRANPGLGCDGPANGNDYPQALWVFSSDACGAYDLKGVKIAHSGKGSPVGEITLHFEKEDMKVEAGAGIVLWVVSKP
jgi:hypothetical protein